MNDIEGAPASFSNHAHHLPNNARSLLFMGRSLQLLGRFEEAEEALEAHRNAVALDPGNHAYLFNLGMKTLQIKRCPEAVDALEAMLRVRQNWDRTHLVLGEILFTTLGRTEDGIQHLQRALDLNPQMEQSAILRRRIESYEKKQE